MDALKTEVVPGHALRPDGAHRSFGVSVQTRGIISALQRVLDGQKDLAELEDALASRCDYLGESLPDGTLLLCAAARAGSLQACNALLQHGVDPSAQDSSRIAPLHCAAFSGSADIVALFIQSRADVNASDSAGQTPLFFAPSRTVCEELVVGRADANVLNNAGQSALHLAAQAGMADTLECLATVMSPHLLNLVDSAGWTAADYAVRSRSKSAVRLLRLQGAQIAKDVVRAKRHIQNVAPPPRKPERRFVRRQGGPAAPRPLHCPGTIRKPVKDDGSQAAFEVWKAWKRVMGCRLPDSSLCAIIGASVLQNTGDGPSIDAGKASSLQAFTAFDGASRSIDAAMIPKQPLYEEGDSQESGVKTARQNDSSFGQDSFQFDGTELGVGDSVGNDQVCDYFDEPEDGKHVLEESSGTCDPMQVSERLEEQIDASAFEPEVEICLGSQCKDADSFSRTLASEVATQETEVRAFSTMEGLQVIGEKVLEDDHQNAEQQQQERKGSRRNKMPITYSPVLHVVAMELSSKILGIVTDDICTRAMLSVPRPMPLGSLVELHVPINNDESRSQGSRGSLASRTSEDIHIVYKSDDCAQVAALHVENQETQTWILSGVQTTQTEADLDMRQMQRVDVEIRATQTEITVEAQTTQTEFDAISRDTQTDFEMQELCGKHATQSDHSVIPVEMIVPVHGAGLDMETCASQTEYNTDAQTTQTEVDANTQETQTEVAETQTEERAVQAEEEFLFRGSLVECALCAQSTDRAEEPKDLSIAEESDEAAESETEEAVESDDGKTTRREAMRVKDNADVYLNFGVGRSDCVTWEVILENQYPQSFNHASTRMFSFGFGLCLQALDEPASLEGADANEVRCDEAPLVLLVSEIASQGVLAQWNVEHPESEVQPGDLIIEVNGLSDIQEMQEELTSSAVWLRVRRYVPAFSVHLERQRLGDWGFTFRTSSPDGNELLVEEVSSDGPLALHNFQQAASGCWDCIVMPKMRIIAVNDAERDGEKMIGILDHHDQVHLQILRARHPHLESQSDRIQLMNDASSSRARSNAGSRSSPSRGESRCSASRGDSRATASRSANRESS